jgi:cellulose synthase/poly-beta-1,6-N-acetylglucosamine synthase-like glycosyltransferase
VLVLLACIALVVYVLVGYPAVMAVWARARPRPPAASRSHKPPVALVVAAFNEADVILDKLANVRSLAYPADLLEVIVVADGSDDATARLAREAGARVLHAPERRGKLAAMSRGLDAAAADIVVFSDANNHYMPAAIDELAAPFADPAVGVVTGRKVIDDGSGRPLDAAEGLYWRYESRIKSWESAVGSTIGAVGEIVAFRRHAFRAPPPGTMNEDFAQAMLAAADGWRVVYAPGAISVERASADTAEEAKRRRRLTTGRYQAMRLLIGPVLRRDPRLAWQMMSHKGLRPLVPAALGGAVVSGAALAWRRGHGRWIAAGLAAFAGAALLGRRAEGRGRRRLLYAPYFVARMNIATIQGFVDFVRGRREAVWAKVARG